MNNLTTQELERFLFLLYPIYEKHPNDQDWATIQKLRELIRERGNIPFTDLNEDYSKEEL
jgi:hypothetical protein